MPTQAAFHSFTREATNIRARAEGAVTYPMVSASSAQPVERLKGATESCSVSTCACITTRGSKRPRNMKIAFVLILLRNFPQVTYFNQDFDHYL
jgi:hypothetical protein